MNDRAPIRDRTLVLRILVPGLEASLRDKMKEAEDSQQNSSSSGGGGAGGGGSNNANNNNKSSNSNNSPNSRGGGGGGNNGTGNNSKELFLDLDGVTCEPTAARNRTLWNFHCDGATYPAKLVNLPCQVELAKTHDHLAYYKCADVGQMLIVYEDEMMLEEADEKPLEGFPSYYPSGLTPPMRRVVERRFAAREHKAVAPPRAAVSDVEGELTELMDKLSKDEKSKRKNNKLPVLTTSTRVLEEVEEDVVEYEPWMDDYGRQPQGLEFDADDQLCSVHPEVWLSPDAIEDVRDEDLAARKKKQAAADKKEAKRKEKKKPKEAAAAAGGPGESSSGPKKGIASKKNREVVDEVALAAASMLTAAEGFDLMGEVMGDDDFFNDLDLADEDMNFDDVNL